MKFHSLPIRHGTEDSFKVAPEHQRHLLPRTAVGHNPSCKVAKILRPEEAQGPDVKAATPKGGRSAFNLGYRPVQAMGRPEAGSA